MKITIDTDLREIKVEQEDQSTSQLSLYSQEGFKLISEIWLKQQWNQLHWQSFSWFGLRIRQFPEDLIRLQEVLFQIKPDVIIETGIKNGGSSVFFASMCKLMGKGKVISVDIDLPSEVQKDIQNSIFGEMITLHEGSSTAPEIVQKIKEAVQETDKVFIFLDSNHTKAHVLKELELYSSLLSEDSYIVATDGVMQSLTDAPLGHANWSENNPAAAAREFVSQNDEFIIERPKALFGEEYVIEEMTYWPDAWIKRRPKD